MMQPSILPYTQQLTLPFTKMHGLGNDFIVIDEFSGSARDCKGILKGEFPKDLAKILCNRRRGIGADQILRLVAAKNAQCDVRMDIINADGSMAEMCGNGIRAVALYLSRYGKPKDHYQVETLAGIQAVTLQDSLVRVDMGTPKFAAQSEMLRFQDGCNGLEKKFREVSMGNPHAVFFVADVQAIPLEQWGPKIETHPRFPQRTNVEFVQVINPTEIHVRVWERGAGVTEACGTGSCAAVVAATLEGKVQKGAPITVRLSGGSLEIQWETGPVWMTGEAEEVFFGSFKLPAQAS